MWIIPKNLSVSPSAPGEEVSISELNSRLDRLARHATWNGKSSRSATLRKQWKRGGWLLRLSGRISGHSTDDPGVTAFIFSLPDTRVSPSASLAGVVESKIRDTYGPESAERLARLAPASCSWKTSLDTSASDSGKSSASFDGWVTGLRRDSSARRRSARATSGSGCSSLAWPTPSAAASEQGKNEPDGKRGQTLIGAAQWQAWGYWPTASARDWKDGQASPETHARNSRPLNEVATPWSTPRSTDGDKGGPNMSFGAGGTPLPAQAVAFWATPTISRGAERGQERKGELKLVGQAEQFQSSLPAPPTSTDGPKSSIPILDSPRLNPRFVSWLMGWPPIGPDGSACTATEFARWRQQMHSSLCSLVCGRASGSPSRSHSSPESEAR